MNDSIESILKSIAQDPIDDNRALRTKKSTNMRKCFCGHNFSYHNDPELFDAYVGGIRTDSRCVHVDWNYSPEGKIIGPGKMCECMNFDHIKNSEPCKCGH